MAFRDRSTVRARWQTICLDCHTQTTWHNTKEEAIEAWNKAMGAKDINVLDKGKWETVEDYDGDEHYRCSECGEEFVLICGTPEDNEYYFCPHCGTDMRGE